MTKYKEPDKNSQPADHKQFAACAAPHLVRLIEQEGSDHLEGGRWLVLGHHVSRPTHGHKVQVGKALNKASDLTSLVPHPAALLHLAQYNSYYYGGPKNLGSRENK